MVHEFKIFCYKIEALKGFYSSLFLFSVWLATFSGFALFRKGLAVSLAPLKRFSTGVDEGIAQKTAFAKLLKRGNFELFSLKIKMDHVFELMLRPCLKIHDFDSLLFHSLFCLLVQLTGVNSPLSQRNRFGN